MGFLEALNKASAEELGAIDAEIVTVKKRLDCLTSARKLLAIALNGKAPRAKPGQGKAARKKAEAAQDDDDDEEKPSVPKGRETVRDRILKYLCHAGASSVQAIAVAVHDEAKNMYTPLNFYWFQKLPDGKWTLSPDGEKAVGVK